MKCDSENRLFQLDKSELLALAEFASTDRTRGNISCVRFEPEHGTAVATDGHALVAVKNGGCYQGPAFSVPIASIVQAAKALKKNDSLAVSCDQNKVTLKVITTGTPLDIVCDVAEDLYPAWRQVVPEAKDDAPARGFGMNALLLERLVLVQKAAMQNGGTWTVPSDPLAPLLVEYNGFESKWTAVIMPMRV